jgi:hypothetical protein
MATASYAGLGGATPYTSTTTSTSGLGAATAPYAQNVLAAGQAISMNDPFHAYTGQTVAGPTGLQQTAADSVSGLNAGNLATQGTAMTQQGASYQPNHTAFGADQAQQYMNPYQQNVIDIANKEAGRSADIQGTMDSSKAAQAGAFGGSRQGVVDAERERNLAMLQNNNQMQGQAAAYTNAQQQFNADQARGNQSDQYASQAALAGGNALTSQGAQAFNQQQVAGSQQQAAAQGDLTNDYNNFKGAVQHPYDQLNFMSNLVKAVPDTASSQSTTYTPDNSASAPNGVQQASDTLGGLAGLAKAGSDLWGVGSSIASLFAKGGMVPAGHPPLRSGLPQARIAQMYGSMK